MNYQIKFPKLSVSIIFLYAINDAMLTARLYCVFSRNKIITKISPPSNEVVMMTCALFQALIEQKALEVLIKTLVSVSLYLENNLNVIKGIKKIPEYDKSLFYFSSSWKPQIISN
jgi:hypothetical protein